SLDWHQAKLHLDNPDWQESIEDNRRILIKSGLWGVPSFRLLDASQNEVFSSWGRDRIWLLTREINNALIRN
ncbi:MAG: 2-hydroxychromene-2-carboxylate isomerase, partial [Woeseiaceae bacterium]|nr:2-hydroxychromene-2-carboxylate isomerase [Woeseiaceae bacterium]